MTPEVRAMALADIKSFGVTAIVAGRYPGQLAIVDFLTEIEGQAPVDDGGVKVWGTVSP